jgi:hypothetical protein
MDAYLRIYSNAVGLYVKDSCDLRDDAVSWWFHMSILPEGHQAECSISCILFVFLWVWLKIALSPNLFDNVRWDGLVPSWRALVNFLLAKGTASCEHNLPSCFVIWAQVRMLAAQVGISRILSPDSFDSPLRTYLNVDSNHGPRCYWNSQRFAFCFKPVYRTTTAT